MPDFGAKKLIRNLKVVPDGLVLAGLGMDWGGVWAGSWKGFACFGQGGAQNLFIMG